MHAVEGKNRQPLRLFNTLPEKAVSKHGSVNDVSSEDALLIKLHFKKED